MKLNGNVFWMVRAAIEIVWTGYVLMDEKTMRCSKGGQG